MSKKIAVLGGGISGLAVAWNLARSRVPANVVLYEGSSRIGGWLESGTCPGGGIQEFGPRSIRIAKSEQASMTTLDMVADVGCQDSIVPLLKTNKAAVRRLIYTDKHGLVELPTDTSWIFKAKAPFTKPLIWTALKDLFAGRGTGDETVYSFAERRGGKEVADYMVDPLCRGVYAADSKSMSLKSCFSSLSEMEKNHRSILRGAIKSIRSSKKSGDEKNLSSLAKKAIAEKWSAYTFKDGLESFAENSLEYIRSRGVRVKLSQPCQKLSFKNGLAMVETVEGATEYNHVVSTLPAHALSPLLSGEDHISLTNVLDSIKSVTVGVVCLEYEGEDVLPEQFKMAFGYLVPSSQSSRILGVVFDSSTFPEQDRRDRPSTRLTVMIGGEWFEEIFGRASEVSEQTVSEVALAELQSHLGIKKQPAHVTTRIQENCIPKYEVGHSEKLRLLDDYLIQHNLPFTVTGSSFRGVSVNVCIHSAVLATDPLIDSLKQK